jgi:hypothetical protein
MKRTDYFILAGLTLLVLLFGYLVATSRYQEPVPYHMRPAETTSATLALAPPADETSYSAAPEVFPAFGERDVFRTIVPKPTPEPTRSPTPIPPPSLEHATRTWKLESAFGNQASFRDTRTNAEFTIQLGKSRIESYRGREMEIKLSKIDMRSFSATLTFEDQQIVKKMFE